jgi:D-alanyl-D-alanine dipeptidase
MVYKIAQQGYILLSLFIIFCFPLISHAQVKNSADSGLKVIQSATEYSATVKADSNQQLVNLQSIIPNIVLDLRYATQNNFVGKIMYAERPSFTFMRLPAARALARVQKELNQQGLGLKIFDAYRPYSVTEKFWELIHDERYVANPAKGSGHNRGIAVDLTIVRLKTGEELHMPTGFDNFTDSAHHDFNGLPEEVLKNRKLLRETMEKYGFVAFPTEWWHYSLPEPEKYEVMDLGFGELKR